MRQPLAEVVELSEGSMAERNIYIDLVAGSKVSGSPAFHCATPCGSRSSYVSGRSSACARLTVVETCLDVVIARLSYLPISSAEKYISVSEGDRLL